MKKLLAILLLLVSTTAYAATPPITIPQGGTGTSTFPANWFLTGKDSIRITATGTPFFSNFSFVNATGTSATSTNFFATTASSSNLFTALFRGAGLTSCNGASDALTWSNGLFGCNTISAGSSASSTLYSDNGNFTGANQFATLFTTGSSTFQNFTGLNSTTTNATTSNSFSGVASSSKLFTASFSGAGLASCSGTNALSWTAGLFGCVAIPQGTVTSVTGTANRITSTGGATPQIDISASYVGQSSITTIGTLSAGAVPASLVTSGTFGSGNYIFPAQLEVDSSSTLQNFTGLNSTTTNATTTTLSATKASSTTLWVSGLGTPAGTFVAADPTGKLIATSSPSGSNSAFSPAANYATTATLPAYTSAGGVITEVGTGALSVDGGSPIVGQKVLVKNESGSCTSSAGGCNNGLYDVTATGSGIAAFVLTRNSSYNSSANVIPGIVTYIISGTVNSDSFYALTSAAPITVGTTALTYVEVAGGGSSVASVTANDTTLTISPTTGAVLAALNLGNQNIWTAATTTFSGGLTFLTGTSTSATSTNFFSTTASTTNLFIATGPCSGSSALNVVAGKVVCGAVSGVGSASSTLYADNGHFTGGNIFTASTTIGDGSWAGGLTVSGSATTSGTTTLANGAGMPHVAIGAALPNYGYLPNDLLNVTGNSGGLNDYLAINMVNPNAGTCATADLTAANDLASNAAFFADLGHTSSGFTGSGCTNNPFTGFGTNSSYLFDPSGNINVAVGSTSPNASFRIFTGGYTSSNERLRVDLAGRTLIGTSTAAAAQEIISTSTKPQLLLTDGVGTNNPWAFRVAGGNLYLATTSPSTFATSTNSTLTVYSGGSEGVGRVGIGSTTPTKLFTVDGAQSGGIVLFTREAGANPAAGAYGTFTVDLAGTGTITNGTGPAFILSTNGNPLGAINVLTDGNTTSGTLNFQAYNAGTPLQILSLRNSNIGAAGVGTSTPYGALDVAYGTAGNLSSFTHPQLVLTDMSAGANLKHIYASSTAGELAIGSITDAGVNNTPWFQLSAAGATTSNATSTSFAATRNLVVGSAGTFIINGSNGNITDTGGVATLAQAVLSTGVNAGTAELSSAGVYGFSLNTSIQNTLDTGLSRLSAGFVAVGNGTANDVSGTLIAKQVGIGTSTPKWALNVASSTRAQLTLSDGSLTNDEWSMRSTGGNFYIATTSAATFATSTLSFLNFISAGTVGGALGISTSSPVETLTVVGGGILNAEGKPATSTSQTVPLASTTQTLIQMGGVSMTVTLTKPYAGQATRVMVCNPTGTAGALTWAITGAVLTWSGNTNTAPTQTTTANACDLYMFVTTQASSTTGALSVFGTQIANF